LLVSTTRLEPGLSATRLPPRRENDAGGDYTRGGCEIIDQTEKCAASEGGPDVMNLRERTIDYFRGLQDRIVAGLEALDGKRFHEDKWQRPGGGGGRTRVLMEGGLFEKAGVNFSDVHGEFSEEFARQIPAGEGRAFTAAGVSLVLHPR